MKKRILLCGLLLLCLIALCAQAEEPAMKEGPVVMQNGDVISLSLKFSGEMAGMQACVQWDPLCLTLENAPAYNNVFKIGSMVAMLNPDMEKGTLNLVYLRQNSLVAADMEIVELDFRVLDEAMPGMTEISLADCQLADVNANAVELACEGFAFRIGNALPEAEAEPTTGIAPTTAPSPNTAKLYLMHEAKLPEPTATPTVTPSPVPTATPTAKATRTPVPTAKPPAGATGGSVSSGSAATPTVKPTATPKPTVPSITLGSETPVPGMGGLYMKVRNIGGGFAVDLITENVQIGGLQANIDYDISDARLVHAKFSDAFLEGAMLNMVNDAEPGRISLVYSNVNGYSADGSAIFTAEFAADEATEVLLSNVKYTGTGADLSAATAVDQRLTWEIQPEDDLEIVEEDGVPTLYLDEEFAALTLNANECAALRFADRLPHEVYWISERSDVASVSPEGLIKAHCSGLVNMIAMDAQNGNRLAEVRICVRNSQLGLPMEIINVTFDDGQGEIFALTTSREITEAFSQRGLRLHFVDEDRRVTVEGLVPEEMTSIPAGAFDLCCSLAEIEIIGRNITCIEENAFSACDGLIHSVLSEAVTEIQPNAFPETELFRLTVPMSSAAELYAIENGMNYDVIEQAGGAE